MDLSLETVQNLAPDQASLNAAKKLLSPSKWPVKQQDQSVNTIWGECQGSGSKPYYVMADVVEHGYKCTCPSRKFPCKHVLAIMWQFSLDANSFSPDEPPEWVNEWLGRLRKSSSPANTATKTANENAGKNSNKNINLTNEPVKKALTAEESEKLAMANAKRAEKVRQNTKASIDAGIIEFKQWIDDQLRTGIDGFLKETTGRCRQIAARLVDAKATNLASRVDEFPAKLLGLDLNSQVNFVFKELGQLAVLAQAWETTPELPDVKRAVNTSEKREQVILDNKNKGAIGLWQVIGKRQETRKDGLISQATWLVNTAETEAKLALLQDYFPASSGTQNLGMTESAPCILGKGKVLFCAKNSQHWFVANDDNFAIQLKNKDMPQLLIGCEVDNAFVTFDGISADLMFAKTQRWGSVAC